MEKEREYNRSPGRAIPRDRSAAAIGEAGSARASMCAAYAAVRAGAWCCREAAYAWKQRGVCGSGAVL